MFNLRLKPGIQMLIFKAGLSHLDDWYSIIFYSYWIFMLYLISLQHLLLSLVSILSSHFFLSLLWVVYIQTRIVDFENSRNSKNLTGHVFTILLCVYIYIYIYIRFPSDGNNGQPHLHVLVFTILHINLTFNKLLVFGYEKNKTNFLTCRPNFNPVFSPDISKLRVSFSSSFCSI